MTAPWIVIQLGAREHYAIPHALSKLGLLSELITEAWVPPGSAWKWLSPRLAQRYHRDLGGGSARIHCWNFETVAFECSTRLRGIQDWDLVVKRNQWFQYKALQSLKSRQRRDELLLESQSPRPVLFAYSYAACEPFQWAKDQGWRTVLSQIDPGEVDESIISELPSRHPQFGASSASPPAAYWESWRKECDLADEIIVNSRWSKEMLVAAGIERRKLRIIPLAFSAVTSNVNRSYPERFVSKRPLRVLSLGQLSLRKGIAEILDAASQMVAEPIEFWLVGPLHMPANSRASSPPNVRWMGAVPRADAARWYTRADVFLFPTHSDGFGLTQLESMATKLPVIASTHCGDVVRDGFNGRLLPEVSGAAIAESLRQLLQQPSLLAEWSSNCNVEEQFSLSAVGAQLVGGR